MSSMFKMAWCRASASFSIAGKHDSDESLERQAISRFYKSPSQLPMSATDLLDEECNYSMAKADAAPRQSRGVNFETTCRRHLLLSLQF